MQTMKNLWTWAAVGLVGYLVYRQYQKNQATPANNVLPEATASQERTSL